jgi:integral membrane sensor domain MASE1
LGNVQTVVVVAVAYLALAAFSAFFAYSDQDAWGVWLTSGLGLGLVLGRDRSDWWPVLAGAFLGAFIFEPLVGSTLAEALGFALIEVIVTVVGGVVAARLSTPPLRFAAPRDVAAIIAGALALALTGAVLIGLWDYIAGRPEAWRTFRVWLLGNFVAILLIAPFIASWAHFRFERPDARTLFAFLVGAIACALFMLCVYALFSAHPAGFPRTYAVALLYLPVVLFILVALLWGARGATLAVAVGALIAITQTVRGIGPFIGHEGIFGDPVLTAQGYAVALSIAGLLVATVAEDRRSANVQPQA